MTDLIHKGSLEGIFLTGEISLMKYIVHGIKNNKWY